MKNLLILDLDETLVYATKHEIRPDNDFVAGSYWVPNGNNQIERQMHLYRNDSIVPNAAPAAPRQVT